jgi:hypothetical protein
MARQLLKTLKKFLKLPVSFLFFFKILEVSEIKKNKMKIHNKFLNACGKFLTDIYLSIELRVFNIDNN